MQRYTAYNSIIIPAPKDCPMKKELKQKRIIENNIFALKLLFRACPAKIIYTVLTTLVSVGLGLASLYIIRYTTNTAEANGDYVGVLIWLLVLIAAYAAEGSSVSLRAFTSRHGLMRKRTEGSSEAFSKKHQNAISNAMKIPNFTKNTPAQWWKARDGAKASFIRS